MNKRSHICILLGAMLLCMAPAVRAAQSARDSLLVLTGKVDRTTYFLPFYASFEVPENTVNIHVRQSFRSTDGKRCNLDLGLFDQRGFEGEESGFRGWSGGARREFSVGHREATPGYLAGEILPGRWTAVQMLTTEGVDVLWRLEITLTVDPEYAEGGGPHVKEGAKSLNDRSGVYRIAPHVHTHHSDGVLSPAEVIALSRMAGLDGMVSTEHNTTSALRIWGEVQQPDFLVADGLEVTYGEGHWNVIGIAPECWIDFRTRSHDSVSFRRSIDKVHTMGALAIANHPYDIPFRHDITRMDGIEVWNSEWDGNDEKSLLLWDSLLRAGYRMTALASTDFHRGVGIAAPHIQVYCDGLSAKAVIEAIRRGSLSLHDNPEASLLFEVQTMRGDRYGMGSRIAADDVQTILFRSTLAGTLRLIDRSGIFYEAAVEADELLSAVPRRGAGWYRAELRDETGKMIALTNPIYIND